MWLTFDWRCIFEYVECDNFLVINEEVLRNGTKPSEPEPPQPVSEPIEVMNDKNVRITIYL